MDENKKNTLIIKMAEMLMGNSVESTIIESALRMLCEEFAFDGGYVYEINQSNCFCIKERVSIKDTYCPSDFPIKPTKEHLNFSIQDIVCFHRGDGKVETDEILELFKVDALTAIFLTDESQKVCGIIAFYNISGRNAIDKAELRALQVSLQMLGRYIRIRLYVNKLSFAQNSLESILDNTGIDIYVNDYNTHEILYANKSMAAPYGGKPNFYGHKCWEVLFPGQVGQCAFCPQSKLLDENGDPTKIYSWNYERPFDGAWFRVFSAAFRWVDGRMAHVVSSAEITENKRNEETIQYMANYDTLTKLPNRRMLINNCEKRFANNSEKVYMLFFDIDGFKKVNDTLGHDAGDEFLVQLGAFFKSIPLLNGNIYRNGGDEFVAVLDGNIHEFGIRNLIRFIHNRFAKSWQLKSGKVFCNTSVGVACYPENGQTTEALLGEADRAMYWVKKNGGGNICFIDELNNVQQ